MKPVCIFQQGYYIFCRIVTSQKLSDSSFHNILGLERWKMCKNCRISRLKLNIICHQNSYQALSFKKACCATNSTSPDSKVCCRCALYLIVYNFTRFRCAENHTSTHFRCVMVCCRTHSTPQKTRAADLNHILLLSGNQASKLSCRVHLFIMIPLSLNAFIFS